MTLSEAGQLVQRGHFGTDGHILVIGLPLVTGAFEAIEVILTVGWPNVTM